MQPSVEAGPDPVWDGVVRWRCIDLQARIKAEFGVVLHERSAGQATDRTGFSAVVGAPAAPEIGRAVAAGLVLPFANTAAMTAHLAEIARTVAPFVGEMIPRIIS